MYARFLRSADGFVLGVIFGAALTLAAILAILTVLLIAGIDVPGYLLGAGLFWGDVELGQRAVVENYFEGKAVKRIEDRKVSGGMANGIANDRSGGGYYVWVPDHIAVVEIIEEENE